MTIPETLIRQLAAAKSVAVLTGAGVSAESGVPTFRDAQTGLWAQFIPEELATPGAFRRNPRLVWEWYEWRRKLVAKVQPNPGHIALAQMEALFPKFSLITQNVDGLHQRAGSRRVIELHGNITRTKCFDEDIPIFDWPVTSEVPPKCPNCGGLLRPDVVWFEEMLPEKETRSAFDSARNCDVFFSIGTSAQVYPAAALPVEALNNGVTVVEINPQRTLLTERASFALTGASGVVLPMLVETVKRVRKTAG